MNLPFENKVALVTGAGSGMGLATARAFAEAGAAVALADVDENTVRSAAEELVSAGHKAIAVGCNVADEAEVAAMVEQTVSTFGRLDAAYNNAGVQSPAVETADASGEEFDRVNAINLRGVWNCMKHELRQMRKQGSGAIVNCSSIGGLDWHSRQGNLPRIQVWSDRADSECCARICLQRNPHQCSLSGHYRDANGCGHVGQGTGCHERHSERPADWATWPAGGNRGCRSLAVQPWRKFRHRSRTCCRWRLHGTMRAKAEKRSPT